MKKKFLVGSLLPVLAGAAVVGSGFSLWFFNNTKETAGQNNLSKNVTQLVEIGTIEVADDFTVVFDQETRENDLANAGLAQKGIYVDFGSKTNKVAKYIKVTNGADIIENSTKVVFTTTIKLTNGLDEFVKVAYKTSDSASEDFTYDKASHSFSYVLEFDSTIADDAMVFDWTKVVFNYAVTEAGTKKEPTTKALYETFKNLVANEATEINVTYTATLTGAKA